MLEIQIRWKGCSKSKSAELVLQEELNFILEKYSFLEPTFKAEIVCYKNDAKNPFKTRVTLFGKNKTTMRAEFASNNISSSIKGCCQKLDDQCRRSKVKVQNHDNKQGCKAFHK